MSLRQTSESYNSYYKTYRAKWCKQTGLPMYSKKDWDTIEKERLYTRSRAKKEKVNIDTETVCAWYRRQNGYTPLFKEKDENGKS